MTTYEIEIKCTTTKKFETTNLKDLTALESNIITDQQKTIDPLAGGTKIADDIAWDYVEVNTVQVPK